MRNDKKWREFWIRDVDANDGGPYPPRYNAYTDSNVSGDKIIYVVEIEPGIYVNPNDVSSIEDQEYWNNYSPSDSFLESSGSRIILKCGRKIYVKNTRAIDVHDMLFRPIRDVVPDPSAERLIMCNLDKGD